MYLIITSTQNKYFNSIYPFCKYLIQGLFYNNNTHMKFQINYTNQKQLTYKQSMIIVRTKIRILTLL